MKQNMVELIAAHTFFAREQIGKEALSNRIMGAMAKVPRHEFVPVELTPYAYSDQPLPIGFDKTISQPFIIALMTDLIDIQSTDTVLEIGTGLGYHAAILAELAANVYTVEIVEELAEQAARRLKPLGYANIEARIGNGEYGWPEHAPFDKIVVCAASELIPAVLITQLKPGGKMIVPTGMPDSQALLLVEKNIEGRIKTKEILPVRFALLETGH
jgi:protein-L-isoaspartate(D-aspartate) O-methyltransferase